MLTNESIRARKPRKFGSAKGLIRMADDFDEPLEEFDSVSGEQRVASTESPTKDDKADWLIFGEAALRVGNFKKICDAYALS